MSKQTEALKLALELRELADKFSEGWHDGIKIDASDIMLLTNAAEALAEQPAQQEPVACVYKATTKKGETAHFGEYSAAKAWAGWGSVEQVPLKTLTLISKSIKPCPTCEALSRTVMLDQTYHDNISPQRTWVGLTDEEIDRLWSQSLADTEGETYLPLREFARAIEAAHGIKGEA